jgi:predicted translin family RNA/ssDNA-binding protein
VPQIHEKIVEVERIIERPSRDLILALTEKEKSELRKSVKEEYRQRLKEMEANILAYQELLL